MTESIAIACSVLSLTVVIGREWREWRQRKRDARNALTQFLFGPRRDR